MTSFSFFCSFIKGITEFYPEIFEGFGESPSQHQINFGRKWKGYGAVMQLCGNDVNKISEVVTLPLDTCLLYLSYQSDYNQLQNLIQKEIMAKHKS